MNIKLLWLAAVVLGASGCKGALAAEAPTASGRIMFAQKLVNGEPDGQQCSITIESSDSERVYNFRASDAECHNDVHSFFRVENAPSAVLFQLRSDADQTKPGECRPDSQTRWIFYLRTTRQPTTTGWISIPGLRGRPDKDIVDAGGVRLERSHDEGGNIEGKLSCVKIDH
ncbi:hypothetical protein [Pseudomonas sp.]|uniref:hypothetical protein n=1 Tax=Pseudomonas sp. TaxID=306 RepID=UPI0028A69069|nr:hypothetical protein [Pseudomonas sp.]